MKITDRLSPNHGERRAEGDSERAIVDMLVIHYTGMSDNDAALDWMCNPVSQVSAHYFIDEAGTVCRLVPEDRRAWHAGVSSWRGFADINSRSIGIELANPGHEFGYRDFPPAQIKALIDLAEGLLTRHPIPAHNVVGHSDIAPSRKQDPGERFPWQTLAVTGIGLWPDQATESERSIEALLADYGYNLTENDITHVISAFQRHFRPHRFDGQADDETHRVIASLIGQVADSAAIS